MPRRPIVSPTRWPRLTGIDQAVSRRLGGRFDIAEFRREFDRRNGKVTGRYDASVLGIDPFPDSSFYHFGDQSGDALAAPVTSAAVDLYTRKLNWRPDGSYELGNGAVERAWDFGHGLKPAESVDRAAADHRARPEAEGAGRSRPVRSRHAVFRLEGPARPVASARQPAARQARGLSGRPHVLFARRLAPGVPQRCAGVDEIAPRLHCLARRLPRAYLRSMSAARAFSGWALAPANQMSVTLPALLRKRRTVSPWLP